MDRDLLIQHLKNLKNGSAVDVPVYSYVEHTRTNETTHFTPKRIVILEGILLLTDERVRQLADISVFVDTPLDICFIRRLQRDMEERGRSLQSVIDQYRATVRPMFLQFIEPSKQYADIVIPRGGKNRIAINMLKAQILHLLNQNRNLMRLCDTDIERYLDDGIISLTPRPNNDKINGATIDVRLGNSFRVFREHSAPFIDLSGPKEEVSAQLESVMSDEIIIPEGKHFSYILVL